MTSSARPTGITILAVLAAIGGILGILGGLTVSVLGGFVASATGGLGGLITIIGLVALVVGVAELALAYGFWTLKPWAWMLGVGIAVANIVIAILYVLANYSLTNEIISIAVSGVILYYLWQPSIKALFGRS
jgi:hypothetical protein